MKSKMSKNVANFELHVDNLTTMVDIANMKEVCKTVELHMQFDGDNLSKSFTVPLGEIKSTDWLKFDERAKYNPDITPAKAARFLEDSVRQQISTAPHITVYQASQNGLYKVGKVPIYIMGQHIIYSSRAKDVTVTVSENKTQRLDIDTKLSETDVINELLALISLSPNTGRILIACKLGYLMRQAYVEAGSRPSTCVYLYGKTGTNKTTFSSLLTQLYNRSDGIQSPIRLNASNAASVNILLEVRDDAVIFDDLCPADSKQVRSKQEETLIEITRYIGDGTVPAKMIGKNISKEAPKCGVIFTGEYLIGKGSDAARLLPVEMEKPDSELLKYFQDNPLIVSTFYKYFLEWYVENYDDIVASLKEWLTDYRNVSIGVHTRLQDTHFFLNTAYLLLLNYCYDVGYLTEYEAEQLLNDFLCLLNELVKKQNFRAQNETFNQPEVNDYLHYIKKMYKDGSLPYTRDVKNYDQEIHAGVLYNDCLCLRGKWLSDTFSVNVTKIAEDLYTKGALQSLKSKQISALNGKRFYFIPLDRLR
ncbi:MAG: hypothetical protein NC253_06865 [Ruminococcus sp.]|nr:hypothetical protein [Ruminococcus sp.]MCM1382497.1 hypothetical protein [Muribaculaceae bacterium]MCM1480379.1 hypothetical protein [Muribaculaceae bacterium]